MKLILFFVFFSSLQISAGISDAHTESLNSLTSAEQQREIQGSVVDATNETLVGVTIMVEGTTVGTVTDINGNYRLQVPADAQTLVFSFVGMMTQRQSIGDRTTISVTMQTDAVGLEEVVAIGYGTQRRENLTGAVSSVTSEVLQSRPITNIGQGLQGAIPGLNITQGFGDPGRGAEFNIRGFTSITGGGPLILIDGVPMDINLVNPEDIAEVSVLKDAASAAIYGARAAYGVILVTTKRGRETAKPVVTMSQNYSINTPTRRFETMSALERLDYMNEGNMRVSGTPYFNIEKEAALRARAADPTLSEFYVAPLPRLPNFPGYAADTDWPRLLQRDYYPMAQSNMSISGGTDRFDYYTSFSYLHQQGISKVFDEQFNRYNLQANLNYDLTDWFTVGTRISIINSDKVFPQNTNNNQNPEHMTHMWVHSWPHWPVKFPSGEWTSRGSPQNKVQQHTDGGYRRRDINDNWITGTARLTPVTNMSFNVDYSYNVRDQQFKEHRKRFPMFDYTINREHAIPVESMGITILFDNPDYPGESNQVGWYPFTNPNNAIRENWNDKYYVFNAYADYENTFADKHYFKGMVGFNQENRLNTYFSSRRNELVLNDVGYLNLATGESFVGESASEYAIRGAFTRFNYIYDQRYFIEVNARYDGTSKFPKSDRFALFPSVSVAWRLDNEAFLSRFDAINMLKIRASYGSLGNQDLEANYPYIATFGSGMINHIIGGERPMTLYAPGLVSPFLTWETVEQQNLGIDVSFFNNRLGANFDVFSRQTFNMLTLSELLPAVLAVGEPQANAADLVTRGFDLQINWRDQVGSVRYGLMLILSDYTSEITKFDNPQGLFQQYYVGRKIGEIWGLTTDGMFQTDEEARAANQTNITGRQLDAGDLRFKDLNGDGRITRGSLTLDDPGDMSIIGNSTPRYSFGFRPTFGWRNWNLDVFFQGVAKRDVWLNPNYFLTQYTSEWTTYPKIGTDWWSEDNRDALFPRPRVAGAGDVTAVQTRWLQNGAFIRLKQLTLQYTIPQELTRRIAVDRISVYFAGNNMWEYTPMIGIIDPEQGRADDYQLYRSFSFGTTINF